MRKLFEVLLLQVCVAIMRGQNVPRSKYISRRDNNDLWYMSEKIEMIIRRMASDYDA